MPTGERGSWVRRAAAWSLRSLARALAWAALVGMTMWLVGEVMSDRTSWSQWLSWIPTVLTLGGMLACVAGSWVLSAAARWIGRGGGRRVGWRVRVIAALAMVAVAAYMLGVEWRLPAAAWDRAGSARATAGVPVSVLYWNHAGNWGRDWKTTAADKHADVSIHASVRYWEYVPQMLDEIEARIGSRPHYQRIDAYGVLTKWPIVRWGRTNLNLPTIQTKLRPYATVWERGWYWNRGQAAWIELDSAPDLGRNLVVWIVDMPSDPRLHRENLTRIAGETMRAWTGPVMVRGPVGQFVAEEGGAAARGFPAADLIVGDFNIPRRARSLRHMVGDARGVFEAVGFGNPGTYPTRLPLLGIDQMFAAPTLTPVKYETFDPGFGTHLSQRAEVVVPAAQR